MRARLPAVFPIDALTTVPQGSGKREGASEQLAPLFRDVDQLSKAGPWTEGAKTVTRKPSVAAAADLSSATRHADG